jgi:micrococcal nuclease
VRRLLATALVALAACGGGAAPALAPGQGTVVRVVDGDTLVVRVGSVDEHVRMIGVDTPETKRPDHPVECYGPEAARRTAELLPPGTTVRLERDTEARDRYDRLLAYVYRAADGLFVERQLLLDGMADTLVIRPNTAHESDLAAAAAEARRSGTGLWTTCGGNHVAPG